MIFKRKIYNSLLEWKNSPIKNSALLIEGARRIGKSTIVKEFGKNEFNDYLLIDFRQESEETKNLFNNTKDIEDFYSKLFLSQNHVLSPGGLLIFDEVQFCPKARESIKDLVNDGRFYIIETGSLISIKENVQSIMIPSEERRIEMFPMDFEEFLWAIENNNAFELLKNSFNDTKIIDQTIHKSYLEKFRKYMILGGMPKAISIFLETNSYKLAHEEHLDILKLYSDDLRKHDEKYGTICNVIFNSIANQLAKNNGRFIILKNSNKKRYYQIEKSINDLNDFKIINKINDVSAPESPVILNEKPYQFKLYFCDTGLLFSKLIANSKKRFSDCCFDFIIGKKVSNFGALYESIALQQLKINYSNIFYHSYNMLNKNNKNNRYEVDLLFEHNFKVNALEIKSSMNYTTSSLDNLKAKYPQLKINKYVFGIKNIKRENDKITIPIYLLLFL